MKQGDHYTEEGFLKVLNLRYTGISEDLKKLHPNLVPVDRPAERDISPEWLVGFVDGEGSFNIFTEEKLTSSKTTPGPPSYVGWGSSRKVWLYFQITQHGRDIVLMERIVTFLGCGTIKKINTSDFSTVDYKLANFDQIESLIIPLKNAPYKVQNPSISNALKMQLI